MSQENPLANSGLGVQVKLAPNPKESSAQDSGWGSSD